MDEEDKKKVKAIIDELVTATTNFTRDEFDKSLLNDIDPYEKIFIFMKNGLIKNSAGIEIINWNYEREDIINLINERISSFSYDEKLNFLSFFVKDTNFAELWKKNILSENKTANIDFLKVPENYDFLLESNTVTKTSLKVSEKVFNKNRDLENNIYAFHNSSLFMNRNGQYIKDYLSQYIDNNEWISLCSGEIDKEFLEKVMKEDEYVENNGYNYLIKTNPNFPVEFVSLAFERDEYEGEPFDFNPNIKVRQKYYSLVIEYEKFIAETYTEGYIATCIFEGPYLTYDEANTLIESVKMKESLVSYATRNMSCDSIISTHMSKKEKEKIIEKIKYKIEELSKDNSEDKDKLPAKKVPTSKKIGKIEYVTSSQKEEEIFPIKVDIVSPFREDINPALVRVASKQLVKLVESPVKGLINRSDIFTEGFSNKATNSKAIRPILGLLIHKAIEDVEFNNKKAEEIKNEVSHELKVEGMASIGNELVDIVKDAVKKILENKNSITSTISSVFTKSEEAVEVEKPAKAIKNTVKPKALGSGKTTTINLSNNKAKTKVPARKSK